LRTIYCHKLQKKTIISKKIKPQIYAGAINAIHSYLVVLVTASTLLGVVSPVILAIINLSITAAISYIVNACVAFKHKKISIADGLRSFAVYGLVNLLNAYIMSEFERETNHVEIVQALVWSVAVVVIVLANNFFVFRDNNAR